jgi:Na+-transporting NADH:ubiquinone oxidoreductase subunit F
MKVRKPLAITIPDELLSVRQFRTSVSAIRDLTHDIKEVRLRLIDPPRMEFIPGQFIQFEVPPYELTEDPVYRAYSISSPPSSTGELELEIRYVPNGICTTYVHRVLKGGEAVVINGPYGGFRLSDSGREAIFIAGGSGMAPIKSILLDMLNRGDTRRTRYFFGAKSRRDLFLLSEMKELETKLSDFKFIPALSQPEGGDGWTGETGLITEVVDRQVRSGIDAEAYLCGSPLMIDACIKVLNAKGIPDSLIFFDKFA